MLNLIRQLEASLKGTLPGASAHVKMSPMGRGNTEETIQTLLTPARISAVMLLLFEEDDTAKMVLIKRPDYAGVHSGQISFPGGKFEEADISYEQTAFRETEEEIGVTSDQIKMLGALSRIYIPPSNFIVYPFIGFCAAKPVFKPDPKEVQELVLPPVDLLLDETIQQEGMFTANGQSGWQVKAPYFLIHDQKVWGATAAILSEFKDLLVEIKAE